jgi:hypothetical protein
LNTNPSYGFFPGINERKVSIATDVVKYNIGVSTKQKSNILRNFSKEEAGIMAN